MTSMNNTLDVSNVCGIEINGYIIKDPVGQGCIGKVFRAYNEPLMDTRAVKFVPFDIVNQKPHWLAEITKANKLHSVDGVVNYLGHGQITIDGSEYLYIMWDYIQGKSLKNIIEKRELTIQMLMDVVKCSLSVFFACKKLDMQHADFHAGNILIEDVNPLNINSNERKVWITDFGYGTFSQVNETPPMDDYDGLARIIQEGIESIDFHSLVNEEDRRRFNVLKNIFPRYLHETNSTVGSYVRNPAELIFELDKLCQPQEDTSQDRKNIGDFLAAELIGERYDEWDALFVPKFLAADDLLDKNTCVLTGLRGCGKTMIFRRMSYDLQEKLGPAGIPGESSFIGFYLNARTLVEAFPWLPEEKHKEARKQIINFFNAKWCIEILKWLRFVSSKDHHADVSWLFDYFVSFFQDKYFTGTTNDGIIKCIIDCCEDQLSKSKLDNYYSSENRPLSDYSFLCDFLSEIHRHHNYGNGKCIFFFLDDYSTPMVNETMQKILNPIIFRRTANVFFKVSTESTESFVSIGINGKILEDGADYKLIDLGSELLKTNSDTSKATDIIMSIFEKRIRRSSIFSGYDISLEQLLGNNTLSNNQLAQQIRGDDGKTPKELYYGVNVFCNLWSSDVRELIKIFSEMISNVGIEEIESSLKSGNYVEPLISAEVQQNILRDTGGHYLASLGTTTNPNRTIPSAEKDETYGAHLMDITTAFQEISYFDLQNKDSKNQSQHPAKQARKIEITSFIGDWKENAEDYYKGLIRYGVFIQDYRAKSVRGTAAKRLFLRSILIPYCRITFSRRDSITMDWEDFNSFLLNPKSFATKYKQKNENKFLTDPNQLTIEELVLEGGI